MESGTSELGICLLQYLYRVLTAVDPVMLKRDNPRSSESVIIHQRSQRHSNVRLLSGSECTGRIRGVVVLGFVLDPDRVCGNSLALKSLQGLQEIRGI